MGNSNIIGHHIFVNWAHDDCFLIICTISAAILKIFIIFYQSQVSLQLTIVIIQMSTTLDFLCGLAAGWSQILTGQPLDFIKTKFQLSNATGMTATKFAREILKDHGLLGFYRGSSSLFFGFSFTIALEFAIYEACKKYFLSCYQNVSGNIPEEVLSIKEIMVSGGIVGTFVSFVYCPVEYAKIQKQTLTHTKESSLTLLLKEMYNNKLKNIYKGFSATFLRETIGSAFYYGSYENAVRQICKYKGVPRRFADYSDYLLAGSIAGLSYWVMVYPFDVIKTKIQTGQSMKSILKDLPKTAYRGFSVIALRAVIVNGFSFATFEQTKRITRMLTEFAVV